MYFLYFPRFLLVNFQWRLAEVEQEEEGLAELGSDGCWSSSVLWAAWLSSRQCLKLPLCTQVHCQWALPQVMPAAFGAGSGYFEAYEKTASGLLPVSAAQPSPRLSPCVADSFLYPGCLAQCLAYVGQCLSDSLVRTVTAKEPHYKKNSICPECLLPDCFCCGQVWTGRRQFYFSSGQPSAIHLILGVGPLEHVVSSSLSVIVSPILSTFLCAGDICYVWVFSTLHCSGTCVGKKSRNRKAVCETRTGGP